MRARNQHSTATSASSRGTWDNIRVISSLPATESIQPVLCSNCPAICCQLKVLLLPGDNVPEHYIDIDEHGMEILGKLDDGWCVALDRDNMCCSMYERRPFVCREFAMGETDCLDERATWRRIAISLQP